LRRTPELAQRLADQACVDAQRRFSVERYLREMTDVIEEAKRRV
jgi:hypothetical protein